MRTIRIILAYLVPLAGASASLAVAVLTGNPFALIAFALGVIVVLAALSLAQ